MFQTGELENPLKMPRCLWSCSLVLPTKPFIKIPVSRDWPCIWMNFHSVEWILGGLTCQAKAPSWWARFVPSDVTGSGRSTVSASFVGPGNHKRWTDYQRSVNQMKSSDICELLYFKYEHRRPKSTLKDLLFIVGKSAGWWHNSKYWETSSKKVKIWKMYGTSVKKHCKRNSRMHDASWQSWTFPPVLFAGQVLDQGELLLFQARQLVPQQVSLILHLLITKTLQTYAMR